MDTRYGDPEAQVVIQPRKLKSKLMPRRSLCFHSTPELHLFSVKPSLQLLTWRYSFQLEHMSVLLIAFNTEVVQCCVKEGPDGVLLTDQQAVTLREIVATLVY